MSSVNPDDPTLLPTPNSSAENLDSQSSGEPRQFGRYRVVTLLGKGGFGAVYRAVDDQLQRDVAVKVTLGSLIDPGIRQGFLTEARIVASLDHAHAKGLVRRDIKPANILLDRSDTPYLTDFGIALRESEQLGDREIAGTPAYMYPEQARGEGHRIDNRSDISQLPSLGEWLQIRLWTEKKRWTEPQRKLMSAAGHWRFRNWGSVLSVLLVIGIAVGYVFYHDHQKSQREQIRVALDSLQNTLGPAVPGNVKELQRRPADLVLPELRVRYGEQGNSPNAKLSLAFALPGDKEVDAAYLVSRIDDIDEDSTANLIAALAADRESSQKELQKAASECTTPEQWRRKAKLSLAALGIGDMSLAMDVCEFEGRTDHGLRTVFIDEFPRWDFDAMALVSSIQNTTSPALRSAVLMGLGRVPAEQFTEAEKTAVTELANKWYELPDSSTHSAVTWLLRKWGLPEPRLADAGTIIAGRNWYVNSQGATMVLITPPVVDPVPLTDPREPYRQRLEELSRLTAEEQATAENRRSRAEALYRTGQYESALSVFDELHQSGPEDWKKTLVFWRLMSLARLGRSEEASTVLTEWKSLESDASLITYAEIVVPLWLGQPDQARERFRQAHSQPEGRDRNMEFNLASAAALMADSEAEGSAVRQEYIDQAIELLEKWTDNDKSDQATLRKDVNFSILHGDSRFRELTDNRSLHPESHWIGTREVTRGELETFMNDSDYDGQKPVNWVDGASADTSISPTLDHPVQNVTWYDAILYCNWLSKKEGLQPVYKSVGKEKIQDYKKREWEVDIWELDRSADGYRLPRKVEWVFSCRAGTETAWSPGNDEVMLADYCQMDPSTQAEVCGRKLPNAWGLHDMHGNVWEWCWENVDGSNRSPRGGSWDSLFVFCVSLSRSISVPVYRNNNLGFRVLRSSVKSGHEAQS